MSSTTTSPDRPRRSPVRPAPRRAVVPGDASAPSSASSSASCCPSRRCRAQAAERLVHRLVKMIVIPVVFCVVVTGIASMDNLRKAGRIGVKAIGYFLVLSLLSMLIGLVVANVFQPGAGMNVDPATLDTEGLPDAATEPITFVGFVVTSSPTRCSARSPASNILGALLVSIVFGVALNMAASPPERRWSTASPPCPTWCSASSAGSCAWPRSAPSARWPPSSPPTAPQSLQQLGYLILRLLRHLRGLRGGGARRDHARLQADRCSG